jgi:hypothetical protein
MFVVRDRMQIAARKLKTRTNKIKYLSSYYHHQQQRLQYHNTNHSFFIKPPLCRCSSTTASKSSKSGNSKSNIDPGATLSFDDPSSSYGMQSTDDIIRALFMFKICSSKWLVQNCESILNRSLSLFGESLVMFFVRPSIFAHFCAGEGEKSI